MSKYYKLFSTKYTNNDTDNIDNLKMSTMSAYTIEDYQKIINKVSTMSADAYIDYENLLYLFEERIAICQFDGNVKQEEAENIAFREVFESINKKINNITL